MNCWADHPTLCQFVHPWHWLTYGQNAVALATVTAAAGLVGLYLYTRYTKNMMITNVGALNASFRPVLIPEIVQVDKDGTITVRVKNGGNGVATQIFYGCGAVTGSIPMNIFLRFEPLKATEIVRGGLSLALTPGDSDEFSIRAHLTAEASLLLINCLDVGGNIVQTAQTIYFDISNGEAEVRSVLGFAVYTFAQRIHHAKSIKGPRGPRDMLQAP
jgi:hypothetical protein